MAHISPLPRTRRRGAGAAARVRAGTPSSHVTSSDAVPHTRTR